MSRFIEAKLRTEKRVCNEDKLQLLCNEITTGKLHCSGDDEMLFNIYYFDEVELQDRRLITGDFVQCRMFLISYRNCII